MKNEISKSRGTIGVREMPDRLDSGHCHLLCATAAVVRINLDGIWIALCEDHRTFLLECINSPLPAPPPAKPRVLVPTWEEDEEDEYWDA